MFNVLDPLPPKDMKFLIKKDELQINVVLPSPENNNYDGLHLHSYANTSHLIVLKQVQLNTINCIFFIVA